MTDFHMADSGPWAGGTLIWLPTLVVIVGALAYAARRLYKYASEGHFDSNDARWLARVALAIAAVFVIVTLTPAGMYPYKAEYHQWREVSGTVEKIDRRLIGNGDSMEDKFVIRFAYSGGRQFGCDDTRCASVEPGDALTLSCKRAWQYTGTDGYDCRFVSTEAAS